MTHQGKRVEWAQLAGPVKPISGIGSQKEATETLRRIAGSSAWGGSADKLVQRVNGTVGHAGSRHRELDESTLLGIIHYRFRNSTELAHLLSIPDFQMYLSFKAANLAARPREFENTPA